MFTNFEGKIEDICKHKSEKYVELRVQGKEFSLHYDKFYDIIHIGRLKKGVVLRVWCVQSSRVVGVEIRERNGYAIPIWRSFK
jgi:hypothetical protein